MRCPSPLFFRPGPPDDGAIRDAREDLCHCALAEEPGARPCTTCLARRRSEGEG